jgi:hypothetical protein
VTGSFNWVIPGKKFSIENPERKKPNNFEYMEE